MNGYIDKLKTCLTNISDNTAKNDHREVLDFLWEHYALMNPREDCRIKSAEAAFLPFCEALLPNQADALFEQISELCIAYEHAAFLTGVCVGARLMTELNTLK